MRVLLLGCLCQNHVLTFDFILVSSSTALIIAISVDRGIALSRRPLVEDEAMIEVCN